MLPRHQNRCTYETGTPAAQGVALPALPFSYLFLFFVPYSLSSSGLSGQDTDRLDVLGCASGHHCSDAAERRFERLRFWISLQERLVSRHGEYLLLIASPSSFAFA
jgi:hypothetical protein